MWKLFCIYFIIFSIKLHNCVCLPCSYHDTVDLSNSEILPNGSYIYDNILIPSHLIGFYDHRYTTNLLKISTELHVRGCICQLNEIKCVKWCCQPNQIFLYSDYSCIDHNETINTEITINTYNNSLDNNKKTVNLYEYFYNLPNRQPCKHNFALRAFIYDEEMWHMFENGTMLIPDMQKLHTKDEYCLAIDRFDKTEQPQYNLVPFICSSTETEEISFRDYLYASSLIFSVLCMIITMIIYLVIKELRNLHGKALVCYLCGLTIGYSILSFILLKKPTEITSDECYVIGFICYYFFMAAFFWLSVISFDLWWNFSGQKTRSQYSERQRFIGYSIYSWGIALIFLIFAMSMQNSENVADNLKPAIGGKQFCFLDTVTNWSAAIYFYGPILAIIIFNIIMFILTARKINHVQCEMTKIMEREDNQITIKAERDKFGLFLRLFIIMGVTWTFEIITYIFGKDHGYNGLVYTCDALNTLQGFLILALFVVKKKVKVLIMKQYSKSRGRKISRQYSRTTSSNVALAHSVVSPNTVNNSIINHGSNKPLMEKF